jgi:phosphoglycerate dehydrogenase-like enzyme
LCACPNAVLTPHLGYGVLETWRDFYPLSVENGVALLDDRPVRVINPR